MINIKCEVKVYEREYSNDPEEKVIVESHWNEPDKVVIYINGIGRVVVASDLIIAIKNATNTNRF